MKKRFAKTLILRLVSLLTLAALCVVEALNGLLSPQSLCGNLIVSISILLLYPLSFEIAGKSLPYAFGQMALSLMVALSPIFPGEECLMLTLSCVPGLICYTVMRAAEKFRNVKVLFRVDAIWCAVEDYSRMIYLAVLGVLALSALTACRYEAPAWVFFIHLFFLAACMLLCYVRAYSGSTCVIGKDKEKTIKRVIQGNLRNAADVGVPDEHMNVMYGKVLRYMESKKPYLDPNFSLDTLAEAVFSNRVYLSKAINYYSGRNYRQFINYYRIMYATELIKKNCSIRVTELALRCGFHSVVSFNMAFKLYMNMTPSAYMGIVAGGGKVGVKAGA